MGTATTELVPSPATRALAPVADNDSLLHWLTTYWQAEVDESPANTIDAKRLDLQQFLEFFYGRYRTDCLDDWTKSVTKGFITWLQTKPEDGGPERAPYAATTVNRRLATLRTAVKWIRKRREFLAGNPFDGVPDLDTDEPDALGFTELEENRLRAAADKMLVLKNRRHQLPRRDYAIFLVLPRCSARVSNLFRERDRAARVTHHGFTIGRFR